MLAGKVKAGVKVMLSYDYCHFEVCLGFADDEVATIERVNELRKDAQRLADEAVRQYAKAKAIAEGRIGSRFDMDALEKEVSEIEKKPESEWSPEEKAKVKLLEDYNRWSEFGYDYEDDEI